MRSVMIIEDETMLMQAIVKKFKTKGIETVSCSSAEQALDYLKEIDDLPSAIWLDYYLEGANGLEFLHELQRIENAKDIPVIVVSNSAK